MHITSKELCERNTCMLGPPCDLLILWLGHTKIMKRASEFIALQYWRHWLPSVIFSFLQQQMLDEKGGGMQKQGNS